MNEVQLIGRLTRDPELRYSSSGKAICNLVLAVQRTYKNAEGEYEADFIRCTAFGSRAETLANFLRKGYRANLVGSLQTGKYEKEGVTHYTTTVIVRTFTFIDTVRTENEPKATYPDNSKNDSPYEPDGAIDISDDDLPF